MSSKVILYYKESCPNCKVAERAIMSKDVEYEFKSLDSTETLLELTEKGAVLRSVPILEIEGIFTYALDEILEKVGKLDESN